MTDEQWVYVLKNRDTGIELGAFATFEAANARKHRIDHDPRWVQDEPPERSPLVVERVKIGGAA